MPLQVFEDVGRARGRSDAPFYAALLVLGGSYLVLIVAMLAADASYTSRRHFVEALASREIRYAVGPSLASCSVTAILSVLVAVPLGYLMSRWDDSSTRQTLGRLRLPRPFTALLNPKLLLDALLDIPIVLPPLVIGLSLLILFQTPPGKAIEAVTRHYLAYVSVPLLSGLGTLALLRIKELVAQRRLTTALPYLLSILAGELSLVLLNHPRVGWIIAFVVLPLVMGLGTWALVRIIEAVSQRRLVVPAYLLSIVVIELSLASILFSPLGSMIERFTPEGFGTDITYAVPSVILAQFAVSCAFAVRTMRVTFDQITPRTEQVALTLGCSRSQAFWMVVLPQAGRGIVTAGTMAWARALGEFGPILVFAGATRMRTEVLSTTVFLELSVGKLEAAVAVSLFMVVAAVVVLVIVRVYGRDVGSIQAR